MRGFDSKFIDELKRKSDIVEVINRYVPLTQKGANHWGRCPFHHEKTASFAVNGQQQFYHCFGCGKSGDVITFIMAIESVDFNDAVKILAEKAHIPLPEISYIDDRVKEEKKLKDRLLALMKDTATFYCHNYYGSNAQVFNSYIIKRGFTRDTAIKFGIGASLDFYGLINYLKDKGYTEDEMIKAGVASRNKTNNRLFDALGGRLIIPIINQFNQVIAFGGRILEDKGFGKYKNTSDTLLFSKRHVIYNLNNLKKLKNEEGYDGVIMTEGYMDVISLSQAGINNVVASMGTSLTKDQAMLLHRYTDKVYVCFDGDSAGQDASIRGLEIFKKEGLDIKMMSLPEGLDPDEVIKKYGKEGFLQCIKEAKPFIDYKLDVLKKSVDLSTYDGRRIYATKAVKIIKESPSAVEQEDLLKIVRDATDFSLDALTRQLHSTEEIELPPEPVNENKTEYTDVSADKSLMASRFIVSAFLFDKNCAKGKRIKDIEFESPIHNAIKDYIISKQEINQKPQFNDLYEILTSDDEDELSAICSLGVNDENEEKDGKYFNDCAKVLKDIYLNKKIDMLTALFKSEEDLEKRREIALEMKKLLAEKNRN